MNRLPGELQDHICSFTSNSDLQAVALINRRWAAAAVPHLRTVVHIAPWPGSLIRLIGKLNSTDAVVRSRIRTINLHVADFPSCRRARDFAAQVLEQFETYDQLRVALGLKVYAPSGKKIGSTLDEDGTDEEGWRILCHALDHERLHYGGGMDEFLDISIWNEIQRFLPHTKCLVVDTRNVWKNAAPCWSLIHEHMRDNRPTIHRAAKELIEHFLSGSSSFSDLEISDAGTHTFLLSNLQHCSGVRNVAVTLTPYRPFAEAERMNTPLGIFLGSGVESYSVKWMRRAGIHLASAYSMQTYWSQRLQHLSFSGLKLHLLYFKDFLQGLSSTLRVLELDDVMFFRRERHPLSSHCHIAVCLFRFMVQKLCLTRAHFTGTMVVEAPYDMSCSVPKSSFTPLAYGEEVTLGGELARAISIDPVHWCGSDQAPSLQQRVRWIATIFGLMRPAKTPQLDIGDAALVGVGTLWDDESEVA